MSSCSHSNAVEEFMEHFVNNFNLHTLRKNMKRKSITSNNKEFLVKGFLNILTNDKEGEDTTGCKETNELETLIVIKTNIKMFKAKNTMY
jgi:hypothetical protein